MSVKRLAYWRKYRWICWVLLGWAMLSLMMVSWIWVSLMDWRGPLDKTVANYSTEISAKDVEGLSIQAQGVKLELVAANDAKKISAYLYGGDYGGHEVLLYKKEGIAFVKMAEYPAVVGTFDPEGEPGLTLRVIVPRRDYESIVIASPWLWAELDQLKGDKLTVAVDQGRILLDHGRIGEANLSSKGGGIQVENSRISALEIRNHTGETKLAGNDLVYCWYQGDRGDFYAREKAIQGVWQLNSGAGHITIETRKIPYDLMVSLQSEQGQVAVGYDQGDWPDFLAKRLEAKALQGVLGQGNHVLQATTDEGQITLVPKPR